VVKLAADSREKKQANEIDEELQNIRKYGAGAVPCRKEKGLSVALPPETRDRAVKWLRSIPRRKKPPQMRLYLYKGNKRIRLEDAVLFAGGLKTKNDPSKCDNVKQHFRDAGHYAGRIDSRLGTDLNQINGALKERTGRFHTNPINYDF